MTDRVFVDTNVVVYAFISDPRSLRADAILRSAPAISVQVLNEFVHVARRKLAFDWPTTNKAVARIAWLCLPPTPLTMALHEHARTLSQRYGFSIYDANILAAALSAGCSELLSEDMHDGLVVEGRLTIRNPFAS